MAFYMNQTNPFADMPELNNNNQTEQIDQPKVCSLPDTLMTFSDSNRVIKDMMCFSA